MVSEYGLTVFAGVVFTTFLQTTYPTAVYWKRAVLAPSLSGFCSVLVACNFTAPSLPICPIGYIFTIFPTAMYCKRAVFVHLHRRVDDGAQMWVEISFRCGVLANLALRASFAPWLHVMVP